MELGLDAEQRRQVEAILAERRRRAEAVRREMGPALRAILEETEGEIRALLTPEQERRYGELRHRFERRTERFLEGHDHHRPRRWRRHRPPHDEPSAAEPETEDPSR